MTALCAVPSSTSAASKRCDALDDLRPHIKSTLASLTDYLQAHSFAGYDPYDGLESSLFQKLPLRDSKWARLALIHLNKRSPVNLRWLLGVPIERNPKGIALCASAFLKLRHEPQSRDYLERAYELLSWLLMNQCREFAGLSWGYNFDWQSRSFFVRKGTPNAICTIFGANALLDAFEAFQKTAYLKHARACCDFLLQHLLTTKGTETYFRYIPAQDTQIHNINLLAATLLARVSAYTHEDQLAHVARQAIMFTTARQRHDGSWPYGEASNQGWIDNYHTGFNLVALSRYQLYSGNRDFADVTRRAYEFWDRNFWHEDRFPKFYPDRQYPVDIHCVAQTILTYLEFAAPDGQEKIAATLRWARKNMWSAKGYFYFQRHRLYTIRIPYARWGQAWMLYALSSLWQAAWANEPGFQVPVTLGD
jgi:hypothetical protein